MLAQPYPVSGWINSNAMPQRKKPRWGTDAQGRKMREDGKYLTKGMIHDPFPHTPPSAGDSPPCPYT